MKKKTKRDLTPIFYVELGFQNCLVMFAASQG